jgi:Flp pilus assembly protein TadG
MLTFVRRLLSREGGRGQSLVEVAITTPVLLALIMGLFDAGTLVIDQVTMTGAAREGARLAAAMGGTQSNPGDTHCELDGTIVQGVLAVASSARFATVTEIDVYQPTSSDGSYVAGNPVNRYDGSGSSIGPCSYTMAMRTQDIPNEAQIAVRVIWKYQPPMLFVSKTALTMSQYTTMMMAPITS